VPEFAQIGTENISNKYARLHDQYIHQHIMRVYNNLYIFNVYPVMLLHSLLCSELNWRRVHGFLIHKRTILYFRLLNMDVSLFVVCRELINSRGSRA
jgi:hypothetical protein